MATKTIAENLEEQRVLIFNSKHPEIAPKLEKYGIDSTHQAGGENLYNEVLALMEKQNLEKQEERLAYDKATVLRNQCKKQFKANHRLIGLASRKDADLQNRIKVNVTRATKIEPWIQQTIEFYTLVLNETDLLSIVLRYGITADTLSSDLNDLKTLKELRNEASAEKGQAQEATRLRDEKMDELDDYCFELETIARIALADEPQLLEILGILVRS